jgi:hypothetical protein
MNCIEEQKELRIKIEELQRREERQKKIEQDQNIASFPLDKGKVARSDG